MTIAEWLAVGTGLTNLAVTVVAVGRSYGQVSNKLDNTERRLERLEKSIGNGEPGAYVRRTEWALMNDRRNDEIRELRTELTELRKGNQ